MPNNSFISLLSSSAHMFRSVCYKTVSTSDVDMLAVLDKLSGAPYNIYPRSIEIIIPNDK